MNKQKNIIEFVIYLVLLIVGIVSLIKGFHKKDYTIFSEPKPIPVVTNSEIIPNEDITYDYSFMEDG
jgi:hypothetical protein